MNYAAIIPCHNSGPFLRKTIESVLAQTLRASEIICVDDRSEDGTPELLRQMDREHPGRLRILTLTPSRTRNVRTLGIEVSSSEWLAFLDHDDLWLPTKMERQAERAGDSKVICSGLFEEQNDDPETRRVLDRGRFLEHNDAFRVVFFRNPIVISSAVVHRSAMDDVGGFTDDRSIAFCSDLDLWLKLTRHGFDPAYCPEPLAIRRMHPSNMSSAQKSWGLRAQVTMLDRYRMNDEEAVWRAGGPTAARRAVHWRRLALCDALLEEGRPEEAWAVLGETRREGWLDRRLTGLWVRSVIRSDDIEALRADLRSRSRALRHVVVRTLVDGEKGFRAGDETTGFG